MRHPTYIQGLSTALCMTLAPAFQAEAAAQRPDLTYEVMPNSVFDGMGRAPLVTPTTVGALPATGGLPLQKDSLSLEGIWKYQPDPDEVGIDENWSGTSYDDSSWAEMPVPSNFSREDPALKTFYQPVWFRRHLDIPADWAGAPLTLVFDGVDYFAQVWVNGHVLRADGQHEGYFNGFQFDVTDDVVPGDNVITVMVTNPYDYGQDEVGFPTLYPALAEKVWIKGIFNFHDLRPGNSIPGLSQDWGTGGIVQPVNLVKTGDVSVRAVFITPDLATDLRSADVLVDLVLENHGTAEETVQVGLAVAGETFSSDTIGQGLTLTVPGGLSHVQASIPLSVPRLWWPYDQPEQGNPDLYRLTTSVIQGGVIADQRRDTFGVRSIEMTEEGDDAFWFKLNGKRMFLRGSNSITTEWLAEADRALYEKDAELYKQTGMNVQRVHAHVDKDDLYEVADEEGILLHQDFSLQWEYSVCDFVRPNGDPMLTSNVEVMKRMLADMIYRLYNHPAIALWTMHNEPLYVFTSVNGLFPEPGRDGLCRPQPYSEDDPQEVMLDFSLNTTLDFNELLPTASAIERSRPIHVGSGYGDSHTYDGWYTGMYTDMYGREIRMATEYGAEAAGYRAEQWLKEWLGEDYWPPDTEELQHEYRYHDAQLVNFGLYLGRAQSAYPNFATWAFATQLYQAVVLKYGNEYLRTRRYDPTGVAINFTYQNWWDSITWGFLDADRRPLMAHSWVATSNAPVAAMVVTPSNIYSWDETITMPITVVNDKLVALPGTRLHWELWEETDSYYLRGDPAALLDHGEAGDPPAYAGLPPDALTVTRGHGVPLELVTSGDLTLDLAADSGLTATEVQTVAPSSSSNERHYTLKTRLTAADGTVLHDNWYHYVVTDSFDGLYRRVSPGITPLPRFDLTLTVTGADQATVTLTRLYAEGVVYTGTLKSSTTFADLKPGVYQGTAVSNGRTVEEEITLEADGTMTFDFSASRASTSALGRTTSEGVQLEAEDSGAGCAIGGGARSGGAVIGSGGAAWLVMAVLRRRRR